MMGGGRFILSLDIGQAAASLRQIEPLLAPRTVLPSNRGTRVAAPLMRQGVRLPDDA